jgi:hypothetical protein
MIELISLFTVISILIYLNHYNPKEISKDSLNKKAVKLYKTCFLISSNDKLLIAFNYIMEKNENWKIDDKIKKLSKKNINKYRIYFIKNRKIFKNK